MPRPPNSRRGGKAEKSPAITLRLDRVEPMGASRIALIYVDADAREHAWLMEQTSIPEFMALLHNGRLGKGGRVIVDDVGITLEPPEMPGGSPLLCVTTAMIVGCTPMHRAALQALRADIDALLPPPE